MKYCCFSYYFHNFKQQIQTNIKYSKIASPDSCASFFYVRTTITGIPCACSAIKASFFVSSGKMSSDEDFGDDWVFYAERPDWKDVVPLAQDDGDHPVVQIAYSEKCK